MQRLQDCNPQFQIVLAQKLRKNTANQSMGFDYQNRV